MIVRITNRLAQLALAGLFLATAALAQLPKNLDDDFISENKSTKLHGRSAAKAAQPLPGSPSVMMPAIADPNAIDALDTETLMKMAGQIVTVQGVIVSTYHSEKTDTRFFNFDKKREKLSLVLFASAAKDFQHLGDPLQYYLHKKVQVTGVLTIYRGKPSMVISKPDQIVIVR